MTQDSRFSKTQLIILATALAIIGLGILALVLTTIINRDSDETEPVNGDTQTTQETPDETSTVEADQKDEDDDVAEPEKPATRARAGPEPTPSPFEAGVLPADWDQLTQLKKQDSILLLPDS